MGISLDQYRARIGSCAARSCKSKATYEPVVLQQFPDVDTTPLIMIRVSWKASSLGLLLILLCALCQSQLLLMGGVEPHPGPTAEEINDKRATVIAELVVKAESDTVKDVIRRYKPKMTQNQLQKAFEGVHTKALVETMIFLGVPNCDNYVKPTIICKLIKQIQSFFPDDCGICSQEFTVKLGDSVLLKCSICCQGIHNQCLARMLGVAEVELEDMTPDEVWKRMNPCICTTLPYMCEYCFSATIPSPVEGLKKQKKVHTKRMNDLKVTDKPGTAHASNDEVTDIDSDSPQNLNNHTPSHALHAESLPHISPHASDADTESDSEDDAQSDSHRRKKPSPDGDRHRRHKSSSGNQKTDRTARPVDDSTGRN